MGALTQPDPDWPGSTGKKPHSHWLVARENSGRPGDRSPSSACPTSDESLATKSRRTTGRSRPFKTGTPQEVTGFSSPVADGGGVSRQQEGATWAKPPGMDKSIRPQSLNKVHLQILPIVQLTRKSVTLNVAKRLYANIRDAERSAA